MVFIFLNLFLSKGTEMNELLQESLKNIRSPTAVFIKRVFQVRLGLFLLCLWAIIVKIVPQ